MFILLQLSVELKQLKQQLPAKHLGDHLRWRVAGDDMYPFSKVSSAIDVIQGEIQLAVENIVTRFGSGLQDALSACGRAESASNTSQIKVVLQNYINKYKK